LFGEEMVMALLISDFSLLINEVNLNNFLIFSSFILLILITIAVIYISYVSWKDKKRIGK